MPSSRYVPLASRAVLAVGGADRREFLQGLISNDIARATAANAIHAALLTAQGRFLHEFFIVEHGDALLLEAEAERLDDLRRRLTLYKLRSKVTLTALRDAFAVVAVIGTDAAAAIGLEPSPGVAAACDGGVAFIDPRLAALGVRALLPPAAIDRLTARGLARGSFADYDALRLSLGVPDGSRDLPVEQALLLENGFDELRGVDWKKGCYVGQEITARMKYRSLVKKRLTPVRIEGPPPAPGTTITLDGIEAGEMRSAAGDAGLALLRLEQIEAAERDARPLRAGEARLTPFAPAWRAS
jgi:folate-binding protein YgfZ